MASTTMNFTGINRAVSDYSNTGACEELINLRPTNTGLVPAKKFAKAIQNSTFNKVIEHNVGASVNYIGVSITSGSTTDTISFVLLPSTTILTLTVPHGISPDSIHVAIAGNILAISISDETTGTYENYCFRWKTDAYFTLEANVPDINPVITFGTLEPKKYEGETYDTDTSKEKINDIINVAFNAIQEQNKTLCFGPVIIAIAFKTVDGDTFWTGRWYSADPIPEIKKEKTDVGSWPYITDDSAVAANYPEALAHSGGAFIVEKHGNSTDSEVVLYGMPLKITIPAITGWSKDTSIIKSIEIYASKPRLYADTGYYDGSYYHEVTQVSPAVITMYTVALPEYLLKDMNLGGELLYLQKSYDMSELATQQEHDFIFGGNIQTTDKTLVVDPGMIVRTGNMLAYNSRFHFYDSNKRVYLGMPDLGRNNDGGDTPYNILVKYESGDTRKTVCLGTAYLPTPIVDDIIIAPTTNVREVILLDNEARSRKYFLTPSKAYNYSICDSGEHSALTGDEFDEYSAIVLAGTTEYIDEPEYNALNVSEQYNPFVFRVEHSYLAPGRIKDVQPQLLAVADISIGNAPLDIFTTQGVYALLQGSGTVLYGAFRSISNLVTESNSAMTDMGTFFIAAGGLWRIAGLHSELVSDALSLGPHTFVRNAKIGNEYSYQKLCNDANNYDISSCESTVSFEDYLKGAVLVYNRFRDEVVVCNSAYGYSYVLSLKYRQWFKIAGTYSQEIVGSDIAMATRDYIPAGLKANINISEPTDNTTITIYITRGGLIEAYINYEYEGDSITALTDSIVALWNDDPANSDYVAEVWSEVGEIKGLTFTIANNLPGTERTEVYYDDDLGETDRAAFMVPHDIYSFSDEVETGALTVHLQSRPLSFGFQYSHIHRIVDMVRTALSMGQNLTVALYGSDDLQEWKLITYANRKVTSASDLKISQLRTGPSARSWRYYTVTVGGKVPVDTDFGPLLIDVTPVVRRIG